MHACLVALLLAAAPQDPDVTRAATLFELAELQQAEALLLEILERPALVESDRALALQYLASTYLAQGKEDEARRTLDTLVARIPRARVDRTRFDPRLIRMHEEALARAAAAAPPPPAAAPQVRAEPPPKPPSRVLPIALIASGAVLQGAGLYGVASVRARHDHWDKARPGEQLPFTRAQAEQDRSWLYATSWAGTVAGAGFIASGLWLLLAEPGASDGAASSEPSAAITLLPEGGVGAAVSGSF